MLIVYETLVIARGLGNNTRLIAASQPPLFPITPNVLNFEFMRNFNVIAEQ